MKRCLGFLHKWRYSRVSHKWVCLKCGAEKEPKRYEKKDEPEAGDSKRKHKRRCRRHKNVIRHNKRQRPRKTKVRKIYIKPHRGKR